MLNSHQEFGKESESLAVKTLKKQGYEILETNFKTKLGEIDIIARDGDTLVFVEVKARKNQRYGDPRSAVTWHKQRKISLTALYYLKKTGRMNVRARFDVVSILLDENHPRIEIVKNAFECVNR
jgi:putative endonuclease